MIIRKCAASSIDGQQGTPPETSKTGFLHSHQSLINIYLIIHSFVRMDLTWSYPNAKRYIFISVDRDSTHSLLLWRERPLHQDHLCLNFHHQSIAFVVLFVPVFVLVFVL